MLHPTLFAHQDVLEPGCPPIHLPAQPQAFFVVDGWVHLEEPEATLYLSGGHGLVTTGQVTVVAGSAGATIWRWALVDSAHADQGAALRSAPQATSEMLLSSELDLDERYDWLMRLDRVSFPAGGTAWTHLHQGPGIRVCAKGEITIETEGKSSTYQPGQAWAEKGVAPVLAPTTEAESTEFIRCFLLPTQNRGRSSLRIISAEDRAKGNTQSYHIFSERLLPLLG